jgi:hypothetical protein
MSYVVVRRASISCFRPLLLHHLLAYRAIFALLEGVAITKSSVCVKERPNKDCQTCSGRYHLRSARMIDFDKEQMRDAPATIYVVARILNGGGA